MASVVQSKSAADTGATLTTTFDAAPTSGNLLIAIGNSDAAITVAGAWTQRFDGTADQGFKIWEKVAGVSEPSAVVITPAVTDYAALTVVELAGVSGLDLVGVVVTAASAATITAGSITTSGAAGDVVIAVAALHGWADPDLPPGTPVWGNSFTALQSPVPTTITPNPAAAQFVGTRIQSSAGAVGTTAISWTNTAFNISAVLIAYKAATGGPGTGTFNGAVAAATAAGIPGSFSATADGGLFAFMGDGSLQPCDEYAL